MAAHADILGVLADPGRLRLVAQPIVDLTRGHVVGYEVLSRFAAGTPDLWFAAAVRAGLAPQLDGLVVARALELRADLPPNTFLTVNIEPEDLLDPALRRTLLGAGDLSRFVLELTEHSQISEFTALSEPLGELRDRGAMFATDDVGSGYSGLQSLLAVRPEIVKIDRSLVDGVDSDPAKQAVVRMLGELANRIDGWVLAEGIEREEELVELMRLEVPLAQGYLLGRPDHQLATHLPVSVVGLIRGQAALLAAVDELGSLMELVPLLPAAGGDADPLPLAIEIDAWGRPVAVVVDGHGSGSPSRRTPGRPCTTRPTAWSAAMARWFRSWSSTAPAGHRGWSRPSGCCHAWRSGRLCAEQGLTNPIRGLSFSGVGAHTAAHGTCIG